MWPWGRRNTFSSSGTDGILPFVTPCVASVNAESATISFVYRKAPLLRMRKNRVGLYTLKSRLKYALVTEHVHVHADTSSAVQCGVISQHPEELRGGRPEGGPGPPHLSTAAVNQAHQSMYRGERRRRVVMTSQSAYIDT